MMPRKKRRTILIVSIVLILLIIAIALTFLYITTDSFKSNRTLFAKYLGQNVEGIQEIYSENEINNEYEELLKQSKYATNTEIKVNYTENIGTSSENTENSINQLKLEVKGQTDDSKQYNYQDVQLLKSEEKLSELEYIQSGENYGIRFPDLFDQYLVANQENTKDILEKAGYDEKTLNKIAETIDFKKFFSLTEMEKQTLKTKYIQIISQNTSENNFSKQKNQTIQMNGKSINTNAYALTLTKEQMNNLYLKLLEELKQEEIILGKIDYLQTLLESYQVQTDRTLREEFVQSIDDLMATITRNNIGQEEAKIIVYENYHRTVRTVIQNPEYEIMIDLLSLAEEDYMQVSYQKPKNKKKKIVTYEKQSEKINVSFQNIENEKTKEYRYSRNQKIEGKQCVKNSMVTYEDDSNKVEATVKQETNIMDVAEENVILKEENFINLSELEEEQLQSILGQVTQKLSEEETRIINRIELDDLLEVLKVVGLVKENQNFEGTGVTETEKKRFNSKFEILQGENLENNAILNLINASKDNLIDIEVISGTELKLKLDRLKNKEEVVTTLTDFMEKNKNQKYNAKVEYDETNGLVSAIVLTRVEEK